MGKTLLLLLACTLQFSLLMAQEIRFNALAGYVFNDEVDYYESNTSYYDGTIRGGLRWGGTLEYMLLKQYGIGLSYYRQKTDAPLSYYKNGPQNENFDLSVNWILLGATRYLKIKKLEPYAGAEAGIVMLKLKGSESGNRGSKTRFAWGAKLGTHIYLTETIGIKLQADLHSAVRSVGGDFYFGTSGTGAGISGYSSLIQFGLGGGLVFRFPK